MTLPNFVVIGAAKCGTTSLYRYLQGHPDVYLPARKELHFFANRQMRRFVGGPGDENMLPFICTDQEQYEAEYEGVRSESAVGDISPSYFYYADAAARIKSTLGDPKILVSLRDPVQKAYSQYMHLVRDHRETLSFEQALRAESERAAQGWAALWRYAESSLYAKRLSHYLELFGAARVKILCFEDFVRSPARTLQAVCSFLGVDPGIHLDVHLAYNRTGRPRSTYMADFISKPNRVTAVARKLLPVSVTEPVKMWLRNLNTGEKVEMEAWARDHLREYFRQDVAEVERILGRPVGWLQ